jgi:glucosamine--fructose-6-phosphate aminotransferase (isomerizing)
MSSASSAGRDTRSEILSQPEIWETTLKQLVSGESGDLPDLSSYDYVLFTGCGSTYFLSQWAARHCQQVRQVQAAALPASELLIFPSAWLRPGARGLLVAISRSAETTETLRAVEAFRELTKGDTLAITCNPQGPLAKKARWVLAAPHAQETSVAQTRTFTSMMLLAARLIDGGHALQAHSALPAAARALLDQYGELAEAVGRNLQLDRFFFLGSGARYGLACEAMLKMKEMSLSQSEAYHFMEIRHGPMSMVDGRAVVLGLMGVEGRDYEAQVIVDMQTLQARTMELSPDGAGPAGRISLGAEALPPIWRDPLYLPFLQLVAFHRALAKGLNPDRPTHLEFVVKLDG